MIQFSEDAERLACSMANAITWASPVDAKHDAAVFLNEMNRVRAEHRMWQDKLLADNLAEPGEDRYRREKYGIKEDE